jgi:plasmid stabilization system protein ParE
LRVELSDEAHAQVRDIDEWWRQNRLSAPDLFTAELTDALMRLERIASLGSPYEAGSRRVRRLLLRRTHYHLYFVEEPDRRFVVAVWSAFRGRRPKL